MSVSGYVVAAGACGLFVLLLSVGAGSPDTLVRPVLTRSYTDDVAIHKFSDVARKLKRGLDANQLTSVPQHAVNWLFEKQHEGAESKHYNVNPRGDETRRYNQKDTNNRNMKFTTLIENTDIDDTAQAPFNDKENVHPNSDRLKDNLQPGADLKVDKQSMVLLNGQPSAMEISDSRIPEPLGRPVTYFTRNRFKRHRRKRSSASQHLGYFSGIQANATPSLETNDLSLGANGEAKVNFSTLEERIRSVKKSDNNSSLSIQSTTTEAHELSAKTLLSVVPQNTSFQNLSKMITVKSTGSRGLDSSKEGNDGSLALNRAHLIAQTAVQIDNTAEKAGFSEGETEDITAEIMQVGKSITDEGYETVSTQEDQILTDSPSNITDHDFLQGIYDGSLSTKWYSTSKARSKQKMPNADTEKEAYQIVVDANVPFNATTVFDGNYDNHEQNDTRKRISLAETITASATNTKDVEQTTDRRSEDKNNREPDSSNDMQDSTSGNQVKGSTASIAAQRVSVPPMSNISKFLQNPEVSDQSTNFSQNAEKQSKLGETTTTTGKHSLQGVNGRKSKRSVSRIQRATVENDLQTGRHLRKYPAVQFMHRPENEKSFGNDIHVHGYGKHSPTGSAQLNQHSTNTNKETQTTDLLGANSWQPAFSAGEQADRRTRGSFELFPHNSSNRYQLDLSEDTMPLLPVVEAAMQYDSRTPQFESGYLSTKIFRAILDQAKGDDIGSLLGLDERDVVDMGLKFRGDRYQFDIKAGNLIKDLMASIHELIELELNRRVCKTLDFDLRMTLLWLLGEHGTFRSFGEFHRPHNASNGNDHATKQVTSSSFYQFFTGNQFNSEPRVRNYLQRKEALVQELLSEYEDLSKDDKEKYKDQLNYLLDISQYLNKLLASLFDNTNQRKNESRHETKGHNTHKNAQTVKLQPRRVTAQTSNLAQNSPPRNVPHGTRRARLQRRHSRGNRQSKDSRSRLKRAQASHSQAPRHRPRSRKYSRLSRRARLLSSSLENPARLGWQKRRGEVHVATTSNDLHSRKSYAYAEPSEFTSETV